MLARTQPKSTEKPVYEAKPAPMTKEEQRASVRELMNRYRQTLAYLAR